MHIRIKIFNEKKNLKCRNASLLSVLAKTCENTKYLLGLQMGGTTTPYIIYSETSSNGLNGRQNFSDRVSGI